MITTCYKQTQGIDISFDTYPPTSPHDLAKEDVTTEYARALPAMVFFHGGGLTVGNRKSWFPEWLYNRFSQRGYLFISADYRLIPPSTGHDIVEDIQDLWKYLTAPGLVFTFPSIPESQVNVNSQGGSAAEDSRLRHYAIDRSAIIVAGSSAGGLCAYLCAMNCQLPRPKAILSLYGMGGDFMTSHYVSPKTSPFFRGRELLDGADPEFQEFQFHPPDLKAGATEKSRLPTASVTADSPLSYHPRSYHIPGYPANPRMLLARLYLQLGTYLDYYTGQHEPSLSAKLRELLLSSDQNTSSDDASGARSEMVTKMLDSIPERHLSLFPQLIVTQKVRSGEWPVTVFLHGTDDTAVPVHESRNLHQLILTSGSLSTVAEADQEEDTTRRASKGSKLIEVSGEEHSFDLAPDAEEKYGKVFDEVVEYLDGVIRDRI